MSNKTPLLVVDDAKSVNSSKTNGSNSKRISQKNQSIPFLRANSELPFNRYIIDDNKDDEFLSDITINWTISDQLRLTALDSLYGRCLEFHHNIHSRTHHGASEYSHSKHDRVIPRALNDILTHSNDIVATVTNYSKDNYGRGSEELTLRSLAEYIDRKLVNSDDDPDSGYLWIHIHELEILELISSKFKLHHMTMESFEDLR